MDKQTQAHLRHRSTLIGCGGRYRIHVHNHYYTWSADICADRQGVYNAVIAKHINALLAAQGDKCNYAYHDFARVPLTYIRQAIDAIKPHWNPCNSRNGRLFKDPAPEGQLLHWLDNPANAVEEVIKSWHLPSLLNETYGYVTDHTGAHYRYRVLGDDLTGADYQNARIIQIYE